MSPLAGDVVAVGAGALVAVAGVTDGVAVAVGAAADAVGLGVAAAIVTVTVGDSASATVALGCTVDVGVGLADELPQATARAIGSSRRAKNRRDMRLDHSASTHAALATCWLCYNRRQIWRGVLRILCEVILV